MWAKIQGMSEDFIEGYIQRGKIIIRYEITNVRYSNEYWLIKMLMIYAYFQKLEEVKKVEDDLNENQDEEVTEESEEYEYYYDRK